MSPKQFQTALELLAEKKGCPAVVVRAKVGASAGPIMTATKPQEVRLYPGQESEKPQEGEGQEQGEGREPAAAAEAAPAPAPALALTPEEAAAEEAWKALVPATPVG